MTRRVNQLVEVPGTFFDAVRNLLHTAEPPKTAKARAQRKRDVAALNKIEKQRIARERKAPKKGARKKAR